MSWTVKALGATKDGGRLYRYTQQSAANALLDADIQPGSNFRVVSAAVAYSAVPTQAGVAVTLKSGAGAAYNTQLRKGSANAQFTTYPDESSGEQATGAGPLFGADDKLNVNAPAGGVGITAAASVYIEVL